MIHVAIRGFARNAMVFEDRIAVCAGDLDSVILQFAERHALKLATHELHMIEIEFLDEPDENERFFRLGTDPSGMIMPILIPPRAD
jgi:hypothetical protein